MSEYSVPRGVDKAFSATGDERAFSATGG